MAENVDSIILEQLRLIRAELGELRQDLAEFKADVKGDFLAEKTMIFGLAGVIGQIDGRVENLETAIGAKQ
jgi:hypothetical protein